MVKFIKIRKIEKIFFSISIDKSNYLNWIAQISN